MLDDSIPIFIVSTPALFANTSTTEAAPRACSSSPLKTSTLAGESTTNSFLKDADTTT